MIFRAPATKNGALISEDRKSTRLNSSHGYISYAVFCLKKKQIVSELALARRLRHHIGYDTHVSSGSAYFEHEHMTPADRAHAVCCLRHAGVRVRHGHLA